MIDREFDLARPLEGARFPRLHFKQFGTAQPIDDAQPVGVRK
jgi:hypothetical protein